MAESEEELKRLLMKVTEESEKVGLKLNIQKTKIMASIPITGLSSWWSSTTVAILLCKLHKDTRVSALRCTLETGRVFCQASVWLFHPWVDTKKAAWRRGHKTWDPENLYLIPGLATKEWWDFCLTYTFLHFEFLICKVREVDRDDLWGAFGL